MISGIYKLYNTVNEKFYIGSSKDIDKRIQKHKQQLKRNKHYNRHLQFSWNKYGDVFEYEILETCSIELLIEREQFYLDDLNPDYNLCPVAGSPEGYKHTEETREKTSKASASRKMPDYAKKQISDTLKGHIVSDKTKEKIGLTLKKTNSSLTSKERKEKYRNKMSCHTAESRKKISIALKGKLPVNCKSILMMSIDEKIKKEFKSLKSAGRFLGIKNLAKIHQCCNGEIESYKGYKWEWLNN